MSFGGQSAAVSRSFGTVVTSLLFAVFGIGS